jgi:hypothetical protein
MESVSRFFSPEEEIDEGFVDTYSSTLVDRRWTDLLKREFPNSFIDTELIYKQKRDPLKNFIGSFGRGGIYAQNIFFVNLLKAMRGGGPKVLVHLGMFIRRGSGHANSILIDKRDRTVSVFEPNGAMYTDYRDPGTMLGTFLVKYLNRMGFGGYVVQPADVVCPRIGVQAREHRAFEQRGGKKGGHGFCFIWSLMYIHYHLLNPDATNDEVQNTMLKNYSDAELEKRAIGYTDMILKYVAGIKDPFRNTPRRRCMKFVTYYNQDEDSVLGLRDPVHQEEPVTRGNRSQIAEQCRTILTGGSVEEEIDDYIELEVGEIGPEVFQFDEPKVAQCIRTAINVHPMDGRVKFDKPQFDPEYVRNELGNISPKAAALLAKIQDLDRQDVDTHGKKFKHFIFSDIRQEGAKFLMGALISGGFTSCFEDDRLALKSREELRETEGENVICLLSSTVFDKTFSVGLKKSVLNIFNSRPDNIQGELARIIVLDSGYKEGIDLFDVKYVHIFEPPTTRANLRQTIGRATRFCGQAGLPFVRNEGWRLSVYLYDIEMSRGVNEVFKISRGDDIIKRYIASDHRVAEFETELENFCLEVSVDRDLNRFIHQQIIAEPQAQIHEEERVVGPLVGVVEREGNVQLIPVVPPIRISGRANCGVLKPTRGVPLSTGMFYLLAYCLGFKKTSSSKGKLDNREIRAYLCDLLKDTRIVKDINRGVNDPVGLIMEHQERLKEAFQRGGDFSMLKAGLKNQMFKILFNILETGVVEELERVRAKHRSRTHRRRFIIPQVPGIDQQAVEELPVSQPPEERLSHEELSAYILENYSQCTWPKPKIENQCIIQPQPDAVPRGPKIVKFTPTQEFIRTYFTPRNPYRGMLIQHGVGCGKTCTAIATSTSTFDREGYRIIWVTRTSLKSDLYKNMFDLVCNAHIKEMIEGGKTIPTDSGERMKLLGKAWSIHPISYKQFSNMVEGKNELHKKLVKINGEEDPLRKTLIIIDEAHKLYGGDDMSGRERPNLEAFHDALMNSYSLSGRDSARVLLMTATPYTSNPMEFFQLMNLIRDPEEQLPTSFDELRDSYLDEGGRFTPEGRMELMNKLAGQISYLNRQNDVRQFAQVHTHHILVNRRIVRPDNLQGDIERLEQILERLEPQRRVLNSLMKTERKRKVGRTAAAKLVKEAAIKRLQIELDEVERKIDEIKFEREYYIQVNQGDVDPPIDYSEILAKKCFNKFGRGKEPRTAIQRPETEPSDSGSESDWEMNDEED